MDRITDNAILTFEEVRIFTLALFFQELLINAEFTIGFAAAVQENSINILLGNSKSGGLFILRFLDGLTLFFLGGERVA